MPQRKRQCERAHLDDLLQESPAYAQNWPFSCTPLDRTPAVQELPHSYGQTPRRNRI